jgi:hypothetical protein
VSCASKIGHKRTLPGLGRMSKNAATSDIAI